MDSNPVLNSRSDSHSVVQRRSTSACVVGVSVMGVLTKLWALSYAFRPDIFLLLLSRIGALDGGIWLGRTRFVDEKARLGRGSEVSSR